MSLRSKYAYTAINNQNGAIQVINPSIRGFLLDMQAECQGANYFQTREQSIGESFELYILDKFRGESYKPKEDDLKSGIVIKGETKTVDYFGEKLSATQYSLNPEITDEMLSKASCFELGIILALGSKECVRRCFGDRKMHKTAVLGYLFLDGFDLKIIKDAELPKPPVIS